MPKRLFWNAIGNFVRKSDKKRRAYRQALLADYEFGIGQTKLVSSRGLLASTDIHPVSPRSGIVDISYLNTLAESINGYKSSTVPSVYVCNSALQYFADNVLRHIHRKIVLVSGDSTLPVGEKTLGPSFDQIRQSSFIEAWWVQNLLQPSSKVKHIPVGLDFHTPWIDPHLYSSQHLLPSLQEAEMRAILTDSMPFAQRLPLAYCDWVKSAAYGDRQEALQGIEAKALAVSSVRMPRCDTWKNAMKYAFVVSPSGVGMDCHRTWEAIALGCVPIVKRSHISDLFIEMPVVVVDDWREVNKENLNRWHQNMHGQEFEYSSLFLQIWKKRFRESSQDLKTALRIDDYIMSF